jgi:hypothetical protein
VTEPPTHVLGLVVDDPVAWAEARSAVLVSFDAPRGGRVDTRTWLETAAAIEGKSRSEARALAEDLSQVAGLLPPTPPMIGSLGVTHRASLAIAEAAVQVRCADRELMVVVPEPPVAWPLRTDLRRLATRLLAGAEVVLHAREAWELTPLVAVEFIVGADGLSFVPPPGARSIVTRVFGVGEPYAAWRTALEALGVQIAGGPIAHMLSVPDGIGPRHVLAAAYEAGLDVLEVRDVFEGPK